MLLDFGSVSCKHVTWINSITYTHLLKHHYPGKEYIHFGYPLIPYVLADGVLMNSKDLVFTAKVRYWAVLALSEMICLCYYVGKPGWTPSDVDYFRRLGRYYQINRGEDEEVGLQYMTINCHMLHTFCDIQVLLWGSPPNSSCWGFERVIGFLKNAPHNGKDFQQPMAKQSAVLE